MGASYLGTVTIGGEIGGISAGFHTIGLALQASSAALSAQASAAAAISGSISTLLSALATARAAIRAAAIVDFQATVDASVTISDRLTAQLADPSAYLGLIIAAEGQLAANLPSLDATVQLNAQIDANVALGAAAQAKIDAVDAALGALDTISASLTAVAEAADAIDAALSAAYSATLSPIGQWAGLTATLDTTGGFSLLFDGPLASLGADLDAAVVATGIGGAVNVRVPLVLVQSSDASAVSAVNAVFKVS